MTLAAKGPDEWVESLIFAANNAHSHTAKFLAFSSFIEKAFGVQIEELLPGIEKKIGSKILGVRGSIDLLYSYVILEFKTKFEEELEDGKAELVKYFQALMEQDPSKKHIGVITDCIKYATFVPTVLGDTVTGLSEVGPLREITFLPPDEVILFVDSFLFSKRGIKPTAADLNIRFGPGSPTHALATSKLQEIWDRTATDSEARLKLALWTRNMSIVYGSDPPAEAFIDQTYLVTLVKLIVYLRLSASTVINEEEIAGALTGDYFSGVGIQNLIEEDYFSWVLTLGIRKTAIQLAVSIAKELLRYDVSAVDEDLFKEIYQVVVRQGERHRTGEYYTPEWLAEITLHSAIDAWRAKNVGLPKILDPACGSGTFLTNAINWMKGEMSGKSVPDELDRILSNVVGIDVNPVAVIISRANYVLALRDLLAQHRQITIPVFVSDSMRIPLVVETYTVGASAYDIQTDGKHLLIPSGIVSDKERFNKLLGALRAAVADYRKRRNRNTAIALFEKRIGKGVDAEELRVVEETLRTVLTLVDDRLNSIWVFIISNIYAPIILKENKFDLVVGNPPWIQMKTLANPSYQDFLKEQVFRYNLLEKKQVKLFTHLEMATLFYCRSSDLYLRDGGIIAFLMPVSVVTGAMHHKNFQRFLKPMMKLECVLNFEAIRDIFSLPVMTLVSRKDAATRYPVRQLEYSGKINKYIRNQKLSALGKTISVKESTFTPSVSLPVSGHSYYYDRFKEGPTLTPRNLWFVAFDPHPTLGMDASQPLVKTSQEVKDVGKEAWKDITMKGAVEAEYIYATLLGKDIIPFGKVKMRPVVLPIEPSEFALRIASPSELRANGKTLIADWAEKAQKYWQARRTEKSKISYPRATDRLDYNNLLTVQNPSRRFVVVFNARGADAVSYVVDKSYLPAFSVGDLSIKPRQFVADTTDLYHETSNEDEAHYLAAMVNSRVLNKKAKKDQPRGNYGYRDIYRREFENPVPQYSPSNPDHVTLARLSKECHSQVESHKFARPGSFKSMRNEALRLLNSKMDEIDDVVKKLVSL